MRVACCHFAEEDQAVGGDGDTAADAPEDVGMSDAAAAGGGGGGGEDAQETPVSQRTCKRRSTSEVSLLPFERRRALALLSDLALAKRIRSVAPYTKTRSR